MLVNKKEFFLYEPFETIFFRLADGADLRRLFSGAEVSADFAAPDRIGKSPQLRDTRNSGFWFMAF
jgi:hypothetical protein